MFEFENPTKVTRRANLNLLKETFRKKRFERQSIAYRGSRLYNVLKTRGLLEDGIENAKIGKITSFYHKFKNGYLLGNNELATLVFSF